MDEAIAEFRLARIAAPSFAANYFMLAAAEAKRGNLDEARRELSEAMAMRPNSTIARVRAARNSSHPRYIAGLSWFY
ncbi:MAG TPA: tetratricopeptide repeat protein, partial [Burkholderiaceae bacterium]|nr:tetratricopeptide repeat protein [Burkholderiaceae bacterium]